MALVAVFKFLLFRISRENFYTHANLAFACPRSRACYPVAQQKHPLRAGAKRNASNMQRFTLRDFSDETLTRSPLGLLLLAERAHPSESGLKKTLNPKNVRKEHENASTGVVSEVGGEWINEREQVCGTDAGARGER